jgi:hypothetical protein
MLSRAICRDAKNIFSLQMLDSLMSEMQSGKARRAYWVRLLQHNSKKSVPRLAALMSQSRRRYATQPGPAASKEPQPENAQTATTPPNTVPNPEPQPLKAPTASKDQKDQKDAKEQTEQKATTASKDAKTEESKKTAQKTTNMNSSIHDDDMFDPDPAKIGT